MLSVSTVCVWVSMLYKIACVLVHVCVCLCVCVCVCVVYTCMGVCLRACGFNNTIFQSLKVISLLPPTLFPVYIYYMAVTAIT